MEQHPLATSPQSPDFSFGWLDSLEVPVPETAYDQLVSGPISPSNAPSPPAPLSVPPPGGLPEQSWRVSRTAFHHGTFTVRAEAYWSCKTRELLAYNLEFAELFELPEEVLHSGFLWTDIGLRHDFASSKGKIAQTIQTEHETLVAGLEASARISITLQHANRKILILAHVIHNDVHWICLPQSDADNLIAQLREPRLIEEADDGRRPVNRNATPYDGHMGRFSWKKSNASKRSKARRVSAGNEASSED